MIVSVLINTSVKKLNKVYDYLVKSEDEDKISIGKRVKVNFGKNAKTKAEGIIVKICLEKDSKFKLKYIEEVLDEVSYISESKLKLAKWMSYMYFCNVYDALKLMLPAGSNNLNNSKKLEAKYEYVASLNISSEVIDEYFETKKISNMKQVQVLKFLAENDRASVKDILSGLGITKSVIDTLNKKGYINLDKVEIENKRLLDITEIAKDEKKIPTEEQKNAIDNINYFVDNGENKKILLHGVTGSGKTEVYLQCIENVLSKGKNVIVLVPEISLTHQTIVRFASRFGNVVSMLHSKMSISERKEEYRKIVQGDIKIVIGARSAIFAPIDNIGMIIIDEEHDSSYYSQMSPRYSTKEVAAYIAKQNNAVLLLGSATPEISTYYKAFEKKELHLITMSKRPNSISMPEVIFVDKNKEALKGNEKQYISDRLIDEIRKNKERGEQSIIFLNRRGYEAYLSCNDCREVFKCPNCDVALSYHKSSKLLTCHYCSYVARRPEKCPNCNSENLGYGTFGTEKIEEKLKELEGISVIRMDKDTTILKDSHSQILEKFKNEKIDVLIGTQMVSKGHDIENVTLVGILAVDSMLNMNDYLASERAYSNISQVSGRAGRGKKGGRTIIETSNMDNLVLNMAATNDYIGFYKTEINFRKTFEYPPFVDIIMLSLSSKNSAMLKKEADRLYNIFKDNDGKYKLFNPKVPFVEKINERYRINVVIKTKVSKEVMDKIYQNLNKYEKNMPKTVALSVTRNPVNI